MKNNEINIKENIALIGLNAGIMIAEGTLIVEDFASLSRGIIRFGQEFEKEANKDIHEFAKDKLLDYYGIEC